MVCAAWGLTVVAAPLSIRAGDDKPATTRPASGLAGARGLFLDGYYAKSVEAYRALAAAPDTALAAHVAWTDVDLACGRYRDAIDRLRSVASAGEKSAAWHTALAALFEQVGDYDAAIEHGRKALALTTNSAYESLGRADAIAVYRARYQLGHLFEMLGRRQDAIDAYKPFERQMQSSLPDGAEELTYLGQGFLRYTVLTRNERLKERSKHVLQEVFQEAYEFVDYRYWPARAAAAELLLEKHNLNEAADDFTKVLKINEKAVPALVGLANAALERWDFDTAERQAERALDINPNSAAALASLARLRMLERRYDQAARTAEKILKVNPRSIEGLAILTAAQVRGERREDADATQKRLEAIVPHSAALHHELGVWLGAARQYDEAERHFNLAIEYDPTWSEPRTQLGLLYMQSGNEPGARRVLEGSWNLDPFNAETFNVLELLEELGRFARHDMDHFVLKYDAKEDSVIVPYFADRLARIGLDVMKQFGHEPTRKTDIEVFPTHSRFSVRITGRPWIATVGACTGPVIALQAPRKSAALSTYNWARTLRHEYTHTVTLSATENRIPHWMTEGMAVYAENAPRPWTWTRMLADAIRRDDLFTLKSIDWGFQRPRRRDDRQLAYAQSEWMIEFIVDRWGFDTVKKFLAAFHDRKTQEQAFRAVCGMSTTDFDAAFKAWAVKQAADWNLPLDRYADPTKLKALLLVDRKNARAQAQLAELKLADADPREARRLAREALKMKADEPLALKIMAVTQVLEAVAESNESRQETLAATAESTTAALIKALPDDPDAVLAHAIVQQMLKHWDPALALFDTYRKMRPMDPEGYRRGGGVYLAQQKPDLALPLLEKAFELLEDEAPIAERIAGIYEDRGDAATASQWLERAIEIDPYDAHVHRRRGMLYERLGRTDQAQTAYRSMCILEPEGAEGHARLAALYRKAGKVEDAEREEKLAKERGG